MAFSVAVKHWILATALIYILVFCCKSGKADQYLPQDGTTNGNLPQTGTAGGVDENFPQTGGAGAGAGAAGTQTGSIGADPADIVTKALLCLNDKYIYSSCGEAYRLTGGGNLNVPPGYADQYCGGPCLTETHLVLNCIEDIISHFIFYNQATIGDIRETIKAGCSYGPQRGNFNVAEHIQAEGSNANKASNSVFFGLVLIVMGLSYMALAHFN